MATINPEVIAVAANIVFDRAVALSKDGSMLEAYETLQIAIELGHRQACFHMGNARMTGTMPPFEYDPDWQEKTVIALAALVKAKEFATQDTEK